MIHLHFSETSKLSSARLLCTGIYLLAAGDGGGWCRGRAAAALSAPASRPSSLKPGQKRQAFTL